MAAGLLGVRRVGFGGSRKGAKLGSGALPCCLRRHRFHPILTPSHHPTLPPAPLDPPRSDTKARKLPPALNGLAALTCLDLSDNAFDGLQEGDLGALAGLPNLQVGDCAGVERAVPGPGRWCMRRTWVRGAHLQVRCGWVTPAALPLFPPPQRLLLRCCQLPSVPGELAALTGLTHLDLSRNQLVELPPALEALGGLRELVAEGNCFPRIPQVWGAGAGWQAALQQQASGWRSAADQPPSRTNTTLHLRPPPLLRRRCWASWRRWRPATSPSTSTWRPPSRCSRCWRAAGWPPSSAWTSGAALGEGAGAGRGIAH